MQIRQGVCVQWILLTNHSSDHRTHDRLVHHLGSLGLQKLSYRSVGVYSPHAWVVSEHFISQVFGNSILEISSTLFRCCLLIPFLLLFHFGPEFFHLFYIKWHLLWDFSLATDFPSDLPPENWEYLSYSAASSSPLYFAFWSLSAYFYFQFSSFFMFWIFSCKFASKFLISASCEKSFMSVC